MVATKITNEQLRAERDAGSTIQQIASKYKVTERVIYSRLSKLRDSGYDPDNDRRHKNPENQLVTGYSTLVRMKLKDDPSIGPVLEWVKTNVTIDRQLETAKFMVEALAGEIPKPDVIQPRAAYYDSDKFTVIPIGDPHIGLHVWSEETGTDWDCAIAKRVFSNVFARLLSRAPDTEEVILVNTGDFFHADNMRGETSRSGHKVDLDGRYGKWLEAGIVIARMFVESCLRKYKKVTFVNVPGNHDDILGLAVGLFIQSMYEQQGRMEVLPGISQFQYVHRGNVLLGFAHGHTCKLSALPGKMANDQHKLWGIAEERHWFTGHVHHNQWLQYKEHPGCVVESVGIIPPRDAYAYGKAYGSKRSIQAVIFDHNHGEYERYYDKVRSTD